MGFRHHLSPVLAAATGAMLLAGLIAAPAMTGQAEATAGTRRHGHDQVRSHARSWKQWHRDRDSHWDQPQGRRHHASDRRLLVSCIKAAKVGSDRDRADRQRLTKLCRSSRPRQLVRPTSATLRPGQLGQPTAPRRPAATFADEDEDEPADSIDVESEPGSSFPTTVCEPTTTTTRPPTTSGTTTTTTTSSTSTSTTTTTTEPPTTSEMTTTEPPTTSEPTTTSTITTTRALTTTTGQPPPGPTSSAGDQSPRYDPEPAGRRPSVTGAEPTTSSTLRPPGHDFQPAGPTTTTTTTSQPAGNAGSPTSTVCEPTGGGQLPPTGSSAIPLFVAVVALFAGGLSVLLAARTRPAD